jgi:hypothetical protein
MATLISDLETVMSDEVFVPDKVKKVKFSDDAESDEFFDMNVINNFFKKIGKNLKSLSFKQIIVFCLIIFMISNRYHHYYIFSQFDIQNPIIINIITIILSLIIFVLI